MTIIDRAQDPNLVTLLATALVTTLPTSLATTHATTSPVPVPLETNPGIHTLFTMANGFGIREQSELELQILPGFFLFASIHEQNGPRLWPETIFFNEKKHTSTEPDGPKRLHIRPRRYALQINELSSPNTHCFPAVGELEDLEMDDMAFDEPPA